MKGGDELQVVGGRGAGGEGVKVGGGGGGGVGGGGGGGGCCSICDSGYKSETSRKYREIKCFYCGFSACNSCCEKFILSQPHEAHCMSPDCKKKWPRRFIATSFSQTFLNVVYKGHRENFLMDLEKAKLPETQIYVERIIREEKLQEEKAVKLLQMKELKQSLETLIHDISRLRHNMEYIEASNAPSGYTFMHRCPDESCKGYVSTQWKCGLCNTYSCSQCHAIKGVKNADGEFDQEHVCNEDAKLTVALLKKDTKQCVKCQTPIFKIDGCDQMWCTVCHTAFSWKTGLVEHKIHNPHWYEHMRKMSADGQIPREAGDCGGGGRMGGGPVAARELTHQTLTMMTNLFNRRHRKSLIVPAVPRVDTAAELEKETRIKHCQDQMLRFVRDFLHFKLVSVAEYLQRDNPRAEERENRSLRVAFMRNRICEETFKLDLQRKDKKRQKKMELRDVYETFVMATPDIIYKFIDHLSVCERGEIQFEMLDEMSNLIVYVNQNIADICKNYQAKPILFPETTFYLPLPPPPLK